MPMKAGGFEVDDKRPEELPQETPEPVTTKAPPVEVKPPKPEPSASKKAATQQEARRPSAADSQAPSSVQKRSSVKKPTPIQQ